MGLDNTSAAVITLSNTGAIVSPNLADLKYNSIGASAISIQIQLQ